jgi:hypothetical protein
VRHCNSYDRSPIYLVSDGSDDAELRRINLSHLYRIGREENVEVRYVGIQEKIAFVKALGAKEIPQHVAHFALEGMSGVPTRAGSDRNAILLESLGRLVLSVDDDTICSVGTASTAAERENLVMGDETNPTQYWFFRDRESAYRSVTPIQVDLLRAHEEFLGKNIGAVFQAATSNGVDVDMKATCSHLLSQLSAGKGQILTTYNGIAGDCGLNSQTAFLCNGNANTKGRLTESPEAFCLALQSREIVRQAIRPSIGHGRQGNQTMFVGMDNRAILPPFLPVFRNQDGVFDATLAQLIGDFCSGYLPLSLPHSPQKAREYLAAGYECITISEIVIAAVSSCYFGYPERDLESRFCTLGEELRGIGSLANDEFGEWLKVIACGRVSAFVTNFEGLLTRYAYDPPYWAEELERRIEKLCQGITEQSSGIVPREFAGAGLTTEEVLEKTKAILYQFGELLSYWPLIVTVTRSLALEGVRLATTVTIRHEHQRI